MTPPRAGAPRRRIGPGRWALLLLVIAAGVVGVDLLLPAGPFPPEGRRVVLIQRGQSLREIAAELERVGLLQGTLGFRALARIMGLDRTIKAGQYAFRPGTTVPAMLRALARGMSGLNLVTIPEGLTTSEVSLLLSNHLGVRIDEFTALASDPAFLDSVGVHAPSIEGYLAPDSYEFLPGTSPEVAFRTMVRRTREVLREESAGDTTLPLGLSLHEVLTLASIVESEAQMNDERPIIAQVYLNRLARGMKLQADPTVAYGMGKSPRSRLYLSNLRVDSPFNTYLYVGLPPGPICNPGRASVRGALNPDTSVTWLYFVAIGNGRHRFANTYREHLANIRSIRASPDSALVDSADVAVATDVAGGR